MRARFWSTAQPATLSTPGACDGALHITGCCVRCGKSFPAHFLADLQRSVHHDVEGRTAILRARCALPFGLPNVAPASHVRVRMVAAVYGADVSSAQTRWTVHARPPRPPSV